MISTTDYHIMTQSYIARQTVNKGPENSINNDEILISKEPIKTKDSIYSENQFSKFVINYNLERDLHVL